MEFQKVIKDNDDNIANFKHYDHFYLLLTLAIMSLLCEIVDPVLLNFPSALLDQVKNNKGTSEALHSYISLTS